MKSGFTSFRVVLPPSYATAAPELRARLEDWLTQTTGALCLAMVAPTYDGLATALMSGEAQLAWAPPLSCARLETVGATVLVRAVRNGASTYRAAILGLAERRLSVDKLNGLRAAWVDPDSTGGHLLAAAFLKAHDIALGSERFAGSYQAAVTAVLAGEADLASVYVPTAASSLGHRLDEFTGQSAKLAAVAVTDEAPNDGIVVAPLAKPAFKGGLTEALLDAHTTPAGMELLKGLFRAERFEAAPRNGYRALYLALRHLR